jgi:hypothetical protein
VRRSVRQRVTHQARESIRGAAGRGAIAKIQQALDRSGIVAASVGRWRLRDWRRPVSRFWSAIDVGSGGSFPPGSTISRPDGCDRLAEDSLTSAGSIAS